MTSFSKYDIVVVKFPFASSLKYKARPAVSDIENWEQSGLLKPSIFKSSIATIEKDFIITKLGRLNDVDISKLKTMIGTIC